MATQMWAAADAYHRYMGRWSQQVARQVVDEMVVADRMRWLDVGCGVGSLSEVVVERRRPETVVGIDRSSDFLALARVRVPQLTVVEAGAERLPFRDGSFDAVVSGLVLNFVSDPVAAVHEIARVARPGGTVGIYVWDYDHPDFFLTRFWAGLEAVTGTRDRYDERGRWRLCTEDGLFEVVGQSPLEDVRVRPVETVTVFQGAEDLWEGYLLGVGPSGFAATQLDRKGRDRMRAWLDEQWPAAEDGTISMTAKAFAASGRVPS